MQVCESLISKVGLPLGEMSVGLLGSDGRLSKWVFGSENGGLTLSRRKFLQRLLWPKLRSAYLDRFLVAGNLTENALSPHLRLTHVRKLLGCFGSGDT